MIKINQEINETLEKVIREVWLNDIKNDYQMDQILREASLQCAFYHHLRNRLRDGWLKRHMLRLYPEYYLTKDKIADLAIVQLLPCSERLDKHLRDCVESIITIFEFKYKYGNLEEPFISDRNKFSYYAHNFPDTNLVACFIQERVHSLEDAKSFLTKRQINNWAKGRLTELFSYWDENGNYQAIINSYK